MITKTDYNGWTNYATWRVMLENFDGEERELSSEECKEMIEEYLELQCDNELTLSYALAFINDVNWHEISDALKNK
jgi:hypothetical protein